LPFSVEIDKKFIVKTGVGTLSSGEQFDFVVELVGYRDALVQQALLFRCMEIGSV